MTEIDSIQHPSTIGASAIASQACGTMSLSTGKTTYMAAATARKKLRSDQAAPAAVSKAVAEQVTDLVVEAVEKKLRALPKAQGTATRNRLISSLDKAKR